MCRLPQLHAHRGGALLDHLVYLIRVNIVPVLGQNQLSIQV